MTPAIPMSDDTQVRPAVTEPDEAKPKTTRKRRFLRRFRFDIRVWIYLGVVLTAGGIGLIGFAWTKVAASLSVPLQIPYLISAGTTGLCLVITGSVLAHYATQHRDALERARQLDRLAGLLRSIREELSGKNTDE